MNVINLNNAKSINNLLFNLTNGTLEKNGFNISEGNSSQSSFSKMLSMILGGTIEEQSITTGEFISNESCTNMMIFSSKDDKSTDQTEVDYGSIMNILYGCAAQEPICEINTIGIESNDINSENSINEFNLSIQNPINGLHLTEVNNLVEESANQDLKGYSIVGEKTYQELPVIKEIVNNSSHSSNKTIQSSIVPRNSLILNKSDSNIQHNVFDKTAPIIENFNNTNEIKSEFNRISISKEVLPKELDENQNDVKSNMEFGSNLLENKPPIFNENNKIIEISDESTKIKDTVLSQVEDKIIFMAKDKEGIQQVTMELNPKNLGKVSVKMSVESEKISVVIMALDQKTNSILMSNAQELTRALQNHFNNGSVTVTVTENVLNQNNQSNMNYSQQNSQREQNHNNQNFYNNIDDLEEGNFIAEMINLRNFKLNTIV
ncbi:hypothetical protein J2Z76_001611 [Sedimentibacter acidaminivorans]|uniref:Flagellar hook-length control protein-like C-terminal domain-containing protein n=1 Tax=Sedimentibacter acidaminivorans TaxID=913099 RepID=A0ABS4GDG7_9FIRM|nr:flagellar hook-length control protein FliK [Sedimentibacter acidaminivorans]MBP1925750.1 hypothetical protein [Sedimentibacter acidaminivorans]